MNVSTQKRKINISEEVIQKVLLIVMIATLATFILLPLVSLFSQAFTDMTGKFIGFENFIKYFKNPSLVVSMKNSLFISIVSSSIAVVLGFIFAYAVNRTNIKFKGFFKGIAIVPLFAPSMLYGIALVYLFGNKGIFTAMGIDISLYGPLGIIICEIIFTFPQTFMLISVALSMTDYRLYEAAETLGTSEVKKFFTITVPGIKYALISAFFVAFIMAFTDFGGPKLLGGNYNVLATDMYKQVIGQFNMSMGAVVAMVMLIPVLIAFTIDKIASKKQGLTITSKSTPYKIKPNKLRDTVMFILCGLIAIFIVGIMSTAVLGSLVKLWPYNLNLSLENYKFEGLSRLGLSTYFNSVKIASLTAIFGTIMAFVGAYVVEKINKFKTLRQIAYFIAMVPLALPGLVIGLSYILFFNGKNNPLNFIYGTTSIIVISNIIHFYSVSFLTGTTSLRMLDKEYEVVAKSMKIPFFKLFMNVTVPMSIGTIFEIAVYLFVNSMVTVSAMIFLYVPQTQTAAVSILKLNESGTIGPAAALAVLILLTNIAVRGTYEIINKVIKNKALKKEEEAKAA
ncbi:MAG: putative 2-aminoethylphosphonate ABC transporter permease subunit [Peptostreptococcaceae bacterium]